MSERFRVECLRCRSVWDCKIPNPSWCKFCRAPMSLEVRRQKREYNRLYNKVHPEILRQYTRDTRARRKGALGSFTDEEFIAKCTTLNNRCTYCNELLPLIPDHIVPLSRGGSNCINNIAPACSDCNSAKGAMTYDEFMQYREPELTESLKVKAYMILHPSNVESIKRKYCM